MAEVEKKLNENSLAWEMLAEQKKTIKRLTNIIITIIVVFALTISSIIGVVFWYLNQYDFESTTTETNEIVDIDSGNGGNANYIGNNGEINNGKN